VGNLIKSAGDYHAVEQSRGTMGSSRTDTTGPVCNKQAWQRYHSSGVVAIDLNVRDKTGACETESTYWHRLTMDGTTFVSVPKRPVQRIEKWDRQDGEKQHVRSSI
jgi:hypothetical protein